MGHPVQSTPTLFNISISQQDDHRHTPLPFMGECGGNAAAALRSAKRRTKRRERGRAPQLRQPHCHCKDTRRWSNMGMSVVWPMRARVV